MFGGPRPEQWTRLSKLSRDALARLLLVRTRFAQVNLPLVVLKRNILTKGSTEWLEMID